MNLYTGTSFLCPWLASVATAFVCFLIVSRLKNIACGGTPVWWAYRAFVFLFGTVLLILAGRALFKTHVYTDDLGAVLDIMMRMVRNGSELLVAIGVYRYLGYKYAAELRSCHNKNQRHSPHSCRLTY